MENKSNVAQQEILAFDSTKAKKSRKLALKDILSTEHKLNGRLLSKETEKLNKELECMN